MKSIIRWAIHNSPAMNTLMISVLVVGTASLFLMRREVFPEFDLEIIIITVPYPGSTPGEVEEGICQRLEEAVRSIDGIDKQTAVAQEGSGFLVLELRTDVDAQRVLNEVRSEVDRIPSFPELAEDPEIKQFTLRQPAIRVGIMGPNDLSLEGELTLRDLAETIRRDLLQMESVSQANIIGARDYQIDIEIPEETLRKYGLTLQRVAQIVRRENIEIPGGNMKTDAQEVLLRGKNKRLIGEEIAEIPLVTRPNGVVLTVADLGVVKDHFTDNTALNLINGQPGLVISVDRTKTEDVLRISDSVNDYVANVAPQKLPHGFKLYTWQDSAIDVRDRMNLLGRNGIQGLILVFLVLAVFLDLRLAFWVALGIPVSVLGSCAVLLYFGQSLNMISLFAFLLALGIVVDDAIVIGENIFEHRQRGEPLVAAAINGAYEVLPSVTASIATTIIAFFPLFYVSGVMGKFIAVMPMAVVAMLVISLIESTLILPCHLAHPHHGFFRLVRVVTFPLRWMGMLLVWAGRQTESWIESAIRRHYLPALRWSLGHPTIVVSSAFATLIFTVGFVKAGITPWSIFPKLDSNWVQASVTFPDGTPASFTEQQTERIERAISEVNDRHAVDGSQLVKLIYRNVGDFTGSGSLGPDSRVSGSNVGLVFVELHDTSTRTVKSDQVLKEWREATGEISGADSLSFGTPEFGPGGAPIEFKLLARRESMEQLEAAVEKCKAELTNSEKYPGVVDIVDDSRPGKWEYQVKVKDDAKSMGITAADLAETVRASYYGEEVMRLQRGRHEVKLMVRYPERERDSLASFDEIRIRALDGAERPLTELADVQITRGYNEINRVDQLRSITIKGDIDEQIGNARQTVAKFKETFVPGLEAEYPDVQILWEGQQEQSNKSMASLFVGFAVAIFAMFALLTLEFRSYFQPIIILVIIPFGFVGAIWGHALLGLPITMFSLFGLVALTGVVVNDSIVLIDFINHRRNAGDNVVEALLSAGQRRFRPVVLTSMTTIAGLTPLLLETSFQAQVLIPMAASLCFGLMLATVLVLILVPVFYSFYAKATGLATESSLAFSEATYDPDRERSREEVTQEELQESGTLTP